MGVLYTLVPSGRPRTIGKIVVAVIVALVALARMALGLEAPTDVLIAVAMGVAICAGGVPLLHAERRLPGRLPAGPARSPGRDRRAW